MVAVRGCNHRRRRSLVAVVARLLHRWLRCRDDPRWPGQVIYVLGIALLALAIGFAVTDNGVWEA